MRIIMGGLVVLLAGGLAVPAQARGIDCAKAATSLEKTICKDPNMLDYDARIAAAYQRALTAWQGAITPYVRRSQKIWLERLRAIESGDGEGSCAKGDKTCLREEMRARVDDLESGAFANSGVYRTAAGLKLILTPRKANGYHLRVYNPAKLPDAQVTTLDDDRAALWDGPDFMVSKMGDGNGLPLPRPMGGPDPDGCTLRLLPKALSVQVFQMGACGGRRYAGSYQRLLDEDLSDYAVDIH